MWGRAWRRPTDKLMDVRGHCNPLIWTAAHYWCPWASYQIRKIAGCACARNAGNVFPHCRFQRKPLVSDPGMHHGTCVTHVPWCMSGSLTCGDGENVPGIPGACAPAILRIWQEAHGHTIQVFRIMSNICGMQFIKINLWENVCMKFKFLKSTMKCEYD